MNDALKTSGRKEEGTVFNWETVIGQASSEAGTAGKKVTEHVFYGMHKNKSMSPQDELNELRDSIFDADIPLLVWAGFQLHA